MCCSLLQWETLHSHKRQQTKQYFTYLRTVWAAQTIQQYVHFKLCQMLWKFPLLLNSYLCDLSSKPMQKFVTECHYFPVVLSTEMKPKVKLEVEVDFFTPSCNLRTNVQIVSEATKMWLHEKLADIYWMLTPQTESFSCDYKLGFLLC